MNLGQIKIHNLINKSTECEYDFAIQLGKRIEKVELVNEKDCIRVIPKGWINKKTWREINDILNFNGFGWLSSDKGGYWIK